MTQINKHPSIEAFKFCPNCGQNKLSNDEIKTLICQDCNFTFYFNPAAAVAIIIENRNNEILLLSRALDPQKGMLDLPGGFVDPFETLEEAIIREIMEELNISIAKLDYLVSKPNRYPYKNVTYQTVDIVFYTKLDNDLNITLSDENQEFHWIRPAAIDLEKLAFSSTKNIISSFIKNN
ncbi:MAG: hypothetical protein COA79_15490 [Planctomycetota bacterium]|nr:MAG: hypothetical protein COA79_15490 [Planctomycetota bacterium]